MFPLAGRIALSALALTVMFAATAALVQARAASSLPPPADNQSLQIVYRAFSGEEAVGSAYVMDVDGGNIQPLTYQGQPFFQFSCSGDGTHFAFIVEDQLYTLSVNDTAPRPVGKPRAGMLGISLSGDGKWAALLAVKNQGPFIVDRLDMDSGEATTLMETAVQMQFLGVTSVTLSPDGQRVLFEMPSLRYNLNNTYSFVGAEILEFDVADPTSRHDLGLGTSPDISSDSRVIAYSADGGLALNDRITGVRVPLRLSRRSPYGSGGIWEPAWSPDGRLLAAWSYLSQATIFVTDLDGNTSPARETNGQRQIEPCFLVNRPQALIGP